MFNQDNISGKYRELYYREDTLDKYVINEMKSYKLDFENKVVLDVGANIGAFAKHAFDNKAYKVISVEPEPENFQLLTKNKVNDLHILVEAAAVKDDSIKEVKLYINDKKNKGAHSTLSKRRSNSIIVKVISLSKLIEKYCPDIVKIDIEGGEFEMLLDYTFPVCVKQLALEYHFINKKIVSNNYSTMLHEKIIEQQFETIVQPKLTKNCWATLGIYKR